MVKVPKPGRVKTRLGREIGVIDATWWFRHQVRRVLYCLTDPRWDLVLAVSPDMDGLCTRFWPHDVQRFPQGQGDLGARMLRVFRQMPFGPTVIVGADIPRMSRRNVMRAFELLGRNDGVLGPAPDGGYWLIGFRHGRRLPADALANIRWSTMYARQDTLDALCGLKIALADSLADVDRAADLKTK